MGKLYVAYGSNLNKQQMKGRRPDAKFVGTGVIKNYELQFKGSLYGAHATIAPKEGASVPVGLWTIQSRDESRLDMYEGYRKTGYRYYDKEQVRVNMTNGGNVIGMVYIMDQKMDFGQPTPGYYDTVREGYANCGLDETVLEQALNSSLELAQARMAEEPQHPW
jgi:hypothetical protein